MGSEAQHTFVSKVGKFGYRHLRMHKQICQLVLGEDSGTSSLDSYLRWDDVSAVKLVELLYQIEKA